nr:MAG TPA: hypothetical protein [Ackermannviridae sp.]
MKTMKKLIKKFWDSYKEVMAMYGEAMTMSRPV